MEHSLPIQKLTRTLNIPDEMHTLCMEQLDTVNGPRLVLELPQWEIEDKNYNPVTGYWETTFSSCPTWKSIELVGWKNHGEYIPFFIKGSPRNKLSEKETKEVLLNNCGHELNFQYFLKYGNRPVHAVCLVCVPEWVEKRCGIVDDLVLSTQAFKYLSQNALQPLEAVIAAGETSPRYSLLNVVAASMLQSTRLDFDYPGNISKKIENLLADPELENHLLGAAVTLHEMIEELNPVTEDELFVSRIMRQASCTVFAVDRIHSARSRYSHRIRIKAN